MANGCPNGRNRQTTRRVLLAEIHRRPEVKKWGNSAAIRLPAALLEAADLLRDQPVDIREERGRIIIEPVRPAA